MKQWHIPTHIVTGQGCIAEIGRVAAALGQTAMLVCGARSLHKSGFLERVLYWLRECQVQITVYDAIADEPTIEMVQSGIELAQTVQTQVIIGIGGGSAMDAAKAIAGLYPGCVADYMSGRQTVQGCGRPWIAVPTTAGTGAEATKNAVLIDPALSLKTSLLHDSWFAHTALVDPELTLSCPPAVTAGSGSDALTQAIEAFTSIGATPLTDALAAEAIRLIGGALERAWQNGQDIAARADMLYGSLMAGMALTHARLGGVHGLAHPLGYRYHIPHGTVCGLLLPYVMEYNIEYAAEKYARVAGLLQVDIRNMTATEAARAGIARVRELFGRIGIPAHLGPFGVQVQDFPVLVAESLPSGSLKHNPRPLQAGDVEAILKVAL